MQEYLWREEVSAEYHIAKRTLDRWASTGEGPSYFRTGRRALYARRDVEKWLESCRVAPRVATK